MAESVTLPQAFIDEMVAHTREDEPNECCGVIVRGKDGRLKLFRATNAEASPYRFSIPAGELHYLYRMTEDEEADLFVVYHSHTMSEASPSPTDSNFSRMLETPEAWPYWLLVSLADEPPRGTARQRWLQRLLLVRNLRVRRWALHLPRERGPWPSVRIWRMKDGEATELSLQEGALPEGSSMVRLDTTGDERKPIVTETPIG